MTLPTRWEIQKAHTTTWLSEGVASRGWVASDKHESSYEVQRQSSCPQSPGRWVSLFGPLVLLICKIFCRLPKPHILKSCSSEAVFPTWHFVVDNLRASREWRLAITIHFQHRRPCSLVYMAILSFSGKTAGQNEVRQDEFSQLAPAAFGIIHLSRVSRTSGPPRTCLATSTPLG